MAERAIIGNGFHGLDALITVLKFPGLFGAFASQSCVMLMSDVDYIRTIVKTTDRQPLQIYLD